MRAWRTARVRRARPRCCSSTRCPSRARGGRGARSGAGDPVQPQRPRAHHRRQHDGAARAAVQPGHGGHGRRRRVRRGRRGVAGPARRRDAEGRARRLRRVRDLPGRVGVRHARVDPAARRGRALLPVPPRVARPVRPRRAAGRRERADPRGRRRIGIGRDPARRSTRGARVFATAGTDEKVAAVPRPRRRRRDQLQRRPTSPRSCSRRPATAASTSCSTTSAKRSWRSRCSAPRTTVAT